MAPVPPNAVMGVNFSVTYQSTPLPADRAAQQIAALPVLMAKTFSYRSHDLEFIQAAERDNTLKLVVGTTNDEIGSFANGRTQGFIEAIRPFENIVSWICVGNEPLGSWYNGQYNATLVPAVKNLYEALNKAGLQIGVTVPQNFEFMQVSYPPSEGSIKSDLESIIRGTCDVMSSSGAPFMVNIYPFITHKDQPQHVPLDYCLFTAGQNHWVRDGNYTYKNIFDAMIDALHVALGKIGYPNLEIVIGECGWPTAGGLDANPQNAQVFLQNMINHCKSGSGTPRFPGKNIRCFLFEMYDEDRKPTDPGQFEHYWGAYDGRGQAKFPLTW